MVLEGIRVIDLSQHIAGPYCGLLLADMGAEVIRVEISGGAEDRRFGYLTPSSDSYAFIVRNRGKKGITLNLNTEKGIEILHQLVEVSDVVLESYAIRDKKRLGLDYATLGQINPKIIVASISAFGKSGPYADKTGFDPIVQAMSGAMSCTGFPSNLPVRTAVAWCDYGAGLHAAFGVVLALMHCYKTDKGQEIEASLLDSAVSLVGQHGIYAEYHALGVERPQIGNASPYAFADTFKAKDGLVFISATRNGVWRRFVKAIGREEMLGDPRFNSDWERSRNRELIAEVVVPWVAARDCEQILQLLEEAQVPCSKVKSIAEATDDVHIRTCKMLYEQEYPEAGNVLVSGSVLRLSEIPTGNTRRAPLVGEHNEEIYCQLLGYTPEELEELKKTKVI